MKTLSAAATGIIKDRETTVRYEVHRMSEPGTIGSARAPIIEEFYGLDRARLAALGYALDGPKPNRERVSGNVRIFQIFYFSGKPGQPELIDEIDERVAFRLLNEIRLPRANQLAVTIDQLQSQIDMLSPE